MGRVCIAHDSHMIIHYVNSAIDSRCSTYLLLMQDSPDSVSHSGQSKNLTQTTGADTEICVWGVGGINVFIGWAWLTKMGRVGQIPISFLLILHKIRLLYNTMHYIINLMNFLCKVLPPPVLYYLSGPQTVPRVLPVIISNAPVHDPTPPCSLVPRLIT